MKILTHLLLALLATPGLAWTGSGPASGRWIEGEGKDILAERGLGGEVVGTVDEARGRVDLLYTLSLPGAPGDGVLALAFDAWTGTVHLPDARVDLRYREYGPDGETVFVADRLPRGTLRVETGYDGRWRAVLDVDVADRQDDTLWRRFDAVVLAIDPPRDGADEEASGGGYSGGGHAVASGGCDDGWDDDDDWETDDSTWGDDSGGGCDGDDWESDSDSGSSGCEGDDLDTGDSSAGCDSGGCEGDAIAGSGDRKRRSPVALRLINLVPWLLVFAAIRLMRRRRREGRTTGF